MKLTALVSLLLALVGQDKEKVTLTWQPKQGDVVTTVSKTTMEMKLEANGQEFEVSNKGSKKSITTYVAVTDGKVTKKEIDHKEDIETSTEPGQMEAKEKENPLHGKRITILEKDGKRHLEGADGLSEKETKKLRLEDSFSYFLPKKAVSVGDSWEVKGDDLKKALNDEDLTEGVVTLKLKEVKEIDKVRCAILEAKFEVSGDTEDGAHLILKIEGTITVRLDRGTPVSTKMKGTISMRIGDEEDPQVKGTGPFSVDETATLKE